MSKRHLFIKYFSFCSLTLIYPISVCSCSTNTPLKINDFQLETPSKDYTNTITHKCSLNHSRANVEWKIIGCTNNTDELINAELITIAGNTGVLTINQGIESPGTEDNPYIFDIHAYVSNNKGVIVNDVVLKKYFNVSKYSKPTWIGERKARGLLQDNGQLFCNSLNGMKVADISHLQPNIDWDTVKEYSDIDAVILRCAHGTHLEDTNFGVNVAACNRLHIPYGVYIYSSAANANDGVAEANMVNELIKKNNATPTLPIFFDIEDWTTVPDTADATCPKDSATWAIIWNAFYNRLINLGYHENEIYIYSYPDWANEVCQDPSVYSKLRWCARWNGTFDFNKYVTGFTVNQNDGKVFGWQYSESEIIPGIYSNVTVDCGAFFNIDSLF